MGALGSPWGALGCVLLPGTGAPAEDSCPAQPRDRRSHLRPRASTGHPGENLSLGLALRVLLCLSPGEAQSRRERAQQCLWGHGHSCAPGKEVPAWTF